jgi:hypothetical protein
MEATHQPASSYYDGQVGECIMEAEESLKTPQLHHQGLCKEVEFVFK